MKHRCFMCFRKTLRVKCSQRLSIKFAERSRNFFFHIWFRNNTDNKICCGNRSDLLFGRFIKFALVNVSKHRNRKNRNNRNKRNHSKAFNHIVRARTAKPINRSDCERNCKRRGQSPTCNPTTVKCDTRKHLWNKRA